MRPLFLVGMMGSGKTAVGSQLSRLLNLPFYDLDLMVEQIAGKPVSDIFEETGEHGFRDMETDRLRWAVQQPPGVVSTGGGAVLREENRSIMRSNGWIVYLKAAPEILWQRIQTDTHRPLIKVQNPLQRLIELLQEREEFYLESDWQIDTDSMSVHEVARKIASIFAPDVNNPHQIPITLEGSRDYHIEIAPGLINAADRLQPWLPSRRVVVLSHPVLERYAESLTAMLRESGMQADSILIPMGERSKSLRQATKLYSQLAQLKADRKTCLIALGGGVIGDLGGFAASTYMRGIPYIQIPTTLLAQVDSSVGGKTAVDLPDGKNLVGTLYHPRHVVIDPELLFTLPARQWRNGMAEVLKYGIALDSALWKRLQIQQVVYAPRRIRNNVQDWLPIIGRCVWLKAQVVEEDEEDVTGRRAVLNFGHTVGHAVESVLGYRSWLHGEAVAVGMIVEAEIGQRLGLTEARVVEELTETVQRYGLPVRLPAVQVDDLLQAMYLDKKTLGKRLNIVLLSATGRAELVKDVPPSLVKEVLCRYSAS